LVATKVPKVTDAMFMAAAEALADCSPAKNNPQGNLLPPLTEIREVSLKVAFAVAKQAIKEGLIAKQDDEKLLHLIREAMWHADYVPYKRG